MPFLIQWLAFACITTPPLPLLGCWTTLMHNVLPISILTPTTEMAWRRSFGMIRGYSLFQFTSLGSIYFQGPDMRTRLVAQMRLALPDRKSTRLNSSHVSISYAVF